ncbi:MAG TPA: SLBB domain-containing protein, partial [Gemmatimonadaceae bacterium]
FPYAGTLKVAGETVDTIRARLALALQNYTKDAQIDVRVVGFRSRTYQLAGAVVKPGLYALTNVPLTVSQAIAAAGGEIRSLPTSGSGTLTDLTSLPLADLSHVTLISGGTRQVLDLRRFYLYGDQTQDRLVHAGDIIQVPDNTNDQVHVIGEVAKQGNYPMSSGALNLAQALGEAGGLDLATSNPARIFVFRGGADSSRVFWLDARSPDAMLLATQFDLEPQDVVYVATNALSTWNRVIAQILPTVQTLYETKILVHP